MVFSSAVFLFVFFPLTLILYFMVGRSGDEEKDIAKKNLILCLASLIFYAWGEPVYIVLMCLSIFFNYHLGLDMEKHRNSSRKMKALLIFGVCFNLFMLGFFKYAGFIVGNINSLFGTAIEFEGLPLPVGISFYTFQILSYVIDVCKGQVRAQTKIVNFACYITMFPQLIAGPIVQYSYIERQLSNRTVTIDNFYEGIVYFIRGLGKKVLFANTIGAVYSDIAAEGLSNASVVTAWICIICYTLQIYFDFSGYSDMAVGFGKMFGFEFVQNFNFPYKAISITDFWRRWHISLSSWFRDYVYIPLGGNRKGTPRQILNLFVVWGLTGLWHGASWNFVLWGLYFFVLLVLEKFIFKKFLEKHKVIGRFYLLATVYFGWVFFKFTEFPILGSVLKGMFCLNSNPFSTYEATSFITGYIFFFIICCIACTPVVKFVKKLLLKASKTSLPANIIYRGIDIAAPVLLILLAAITLVGDSYNPFLYFQF